MEKRTLILLITILILGFIISCDGVFLPRNDVQPFEYVYDFNEDLDDYLKDLNNNYSFSHRQERHITKMSSEKRRVIKLI